jgi:MoaA/NifB/PqqE/SkfB family radical SAM enzyme
MDLASVERLLPSLERLKTRVALISGGEPLLNPEWAGIAQLLGRHGLKLWLLTSGLSLAKHARRVAQLFDVVTVSLDGTEPATYAAIRGLDAFDKVCEGIRAAVEAGAPVGLRVTLQRRNYRQLPAFVELAKRLGAANVSFLAVDVSNPHAFGRTNDFRTDPALRPEDLPAFEAVLDSLERTHAEDFRAGFIAESPRKLRRIYEYFRAVQGAGPFPPVRCNAPEFSAVIAPGGRVQPCFFIPGPTDAPPESDLEGELDSEAMKALRDAIRARRRPECTACVCSLWRNLDSVEESILPPVFARRA